jgi:O-antigen/teichoic acid export membrane protein
VPFLVVTIVLPVVTIAARDNRDRLVYMTSRTAQAMALAGILAALLLWTLAGPIVAVFGGPQYAPAAAVLRIQGFAAVTIFVTAAWQPALIGMHRVRSLVVALSAGVAAVVIAGLILIPPFQATGAAWAAVIGDVTLCLAVYVALRRAGRGEWFPVAPGVRIAAAMALAVGVGLIPGIPVAVRAVLVVVVFAGAAVALRSLPSELTDAFRAAAGRAIRRAA